VFSTFTYAQHKTEIQTDPVFRQRFLAMCAPLGIDPLSSKKGFWAGLLGMGDYYHELAVQVAEVCLASRSRNGGIMSLTQVQLLLSKRTTKLGRAMAVNSNDKTKLISTPDIVVAIQKLSKLGGGFRLVEVGSSTMVISVPTELDQDHMTVMELATRNDETSGAAARVTTHQVQNAAGWTKERAERVLEMLLQQGMVWLDEYKGESYYWFPSVWQEQNASVGGFAM
jgi:ESCRT-II complex subunit VPS22